LHVNNKINSNNGHPGTQDFSLGSNATSLYAGALNKDGSIVLAGTENGNLVVYALNPANSMVKTIASKDLGGIDVARSVVIQDDGKIIVAGYSIQAQSMQISLLRYLPDGTLDTSFDQDGIVKTTIGSDAQGLAVLLQADGKSLSQVGLRIVMGMI